MNWANAGIRQWTSTVPGGPNTGSQTGHCLEPDPPPTGCGRRTKSNLSSPHTKGEPPSSFPDVPPNQGRFYPLFDRIVLLTTSESVTRHRLASRTNDDFGKDPVEMAKVLADKTAFEDLLRARADIVIDTEAPLATVVDQIIQVGS